MRNKLNYFQIIDKWISRLYNVMFGLELFIFNILSIYAEIFILNVILRKSIIFLLFGSPFLAII